MRLLAIGDIHGCLDAFDRLLEEVRPGPDDVLVTLGDYVDRGPDSKGVLDRLLAVRSETQLVPLLGNHDRWLLNVLAGDRESEERWLRVGGAETVQAYGSLDQVPMEHRAFLETHCRLWWQPEEENYFFVHASADPQVTMGQQTEEWLLWRRVYDQTERHVSGRTMICGHTAQTQGMPYFQDGAICIDTWAFGGGWLTCLDLTSELFIQANMAGEMRRFGVNERR